MDFHKTYSIQIRFVIRPENILFAGVCVHLFSPEALRAGAVNVLKVSNPLKDRPELILLLPFFVLFCFLIFKFASHK